MLTHDRRGSGPPLLLLHGILQRWQVWTPVVERLAARFDVVAVDFPGFGGSAELPAGEAPTVARLADAVTSLATELGLERPHVAGISLGGWTALELGATGRARSVTAFSPAGLWRSLPKQSHYALKVLRKGSELLADHPMLVARTAVGRTIGGGLNYGRAWRVPPAEFAADTVAAGNCPGWQRQYDALHGSRFTRGAELTVPTTVCWGTRDVVLPWRSVHREAVPSARWERLPGCGHTPTWDDPAEVARLIEQTAGRA